MGVGRFVDVCSKGATHVLRTFQRRQDGNAAVEYVFLLGLIITSGIAGAYFLAGTADRTIALVAGALTSDADRAFASTAVIGNVVVNGQGRAIALARQTSRYVHRWGAGVFAGLCASVVAVGWFALRRRRSRHCSDFQPLPESQFAEADLRDRFFDKRQDLLRLLSRDGGVLLRNQMKVRHLMTTDAVVVSPDTSCARVRELMRESRVRHLLVCTKKRRLLGVISDRDLCNAVARTAADLMTTRIQTVTSDTQLSPAITHLVNEGISCLPVLEDGRLCGILTTTDLILALQCTLQLWLHAAETMHSEAWEQEMLERTRSLVYAADPNICCGLNGVFEMLMARAEANLETATP